MPCGPFSSPWKTAVIRYQITRGQLTSIWPISHQRQKIKVRKMTIYFHHLRSNKTLLFIEEKPFFNKIRSTTNVICLSCHFHEFNKVHFKQNMFTIYNNKYLELSYCLMKLSHFSCQQLISPEIVTIFLMWFLIYLFCYVWNRQCAVFHNTHAFPLHY